MLRPAGLVERVDFVAGPLSVSPGRRRIVGPGGQIQVEPVTMLVFLMLLDSAGQVVTRDQLFDACWGGDMVGDDSLNRAINRVRRIDAETGPGLFAIETIPRTGYRLTGTVADFGHLDTDANGRRRSRRWVIGGALVSVGIASIGITTITLRRSEARFDALLDRGRDLIGMGEPDRLREASALLNRATAERGNSARAWGLLATATAVSADYAAPRDAAAVIERAEAAVSNAQKIDRAQPDAQMALVRLEGSMLPRGQVEARLRHIISVDPANRLAIADLVALLQGAGMTRESWKWNERAIALDPFSPVHLARRALKLWILGRSQEADKVSARVSELFPVSPVAWNARFLILAFSDRPAGAKALLEGSTARLRTMTSQGEVMWDAVLDALSQRTTVAIANARVATLTGARQSPGLAVHGAMAMAALGDLDTAFAIANGSLLSRGAVVGNAEVKDKPLWINNPGWRETQWLFVPPTAGMREDRRFGPLCDGLGLTAYWYARKVVPDYLSKTG